MQISQSTTVPPAMVTDSAVIAAAVPLEPAQPRLATSGMVADQIQQYGQAIAIGNNNDSTTFYTVPAGKLLYVDFIQINSILKLAASTTAEGQGWLKIDQGSADTLFVGYFDGNHAVAGNQNTFSRNYSVSHAYFKEGTIFEVFAQCNIAGASMFQNANIKGFLIDVTP